MEAKIQAELMAAMKEKNAEKIAAIREIKTAIMKFKTSADYKGECTESDILGIIQKVAKQHKESADMYKAAGREDLVNEELAQLEHIQFFLPKMLSEEETAAIHYLAQLETTMNLLDRPVFSIDMRLPDRLTIKIPPKQQDTLTPLSDTHKNG